MKTKTVSHENRAEERLVSFNRRQFLRGLGACIALPALQSFAPVRLLAAESSAAKLATTASGAPLRTAFVYFPNGAIPRAWWPSGDGKDFKFNRTLQPLEVVKNGVQVIGGLEHLNATAGPDGGGDHARANGTFLTGVRMKKSAVEVRLAFPLIKSSPKRSGI